MRDEEEEEEGGLQLRGREFIGFDTFLLGVIFQYDEQHTKVSVEMKVIYLGLGKHHCQSLLKVVRYFSSKERESESHKCKLDQNSTAKYPRNIKTQIEGVFEVERKALASNQIRESSEQGVVRKRRAAEAFELGGQKQQPTNRYTL